MKRQEAVNTFTDGMIMDLNPLSMPNTALSNCLNGTLLTYNGNENMIQNDMGNARVETAMLPTGYIPLGSTSFGGIIYIVSYNPIEKKCQIGSFPSPERNLTEDELGNESNNAQIDLNKFCKESWSNITYNKSDNGEYGIDENGNYFKIPEENSYSGDKYTRTEGFGSPENIITNYYQKQNLCSSKIFAGDKYKVYSSSIDNSQPYISAWDEKNTEYDITAYPKYLKFSIVSTLDNGKTIELTNNSVWTSPNENNNIPYYIYNGSPITNEESDKKPNLDEYRGLVGSNYDTYTEKVSGQLGIAAKLEVPTLFSTGYKILKNENDTYNIYLLLNWANDNIENKSRVNPSGVKVQLLQNGDVKEEARKNIILQVKGTDKKEIPNAINNEDYCTLTRNYSDYNQLLQNIFDNNIARKNDGSDPYYALEVFNNIEKPSEIATIEITPTMPFGVLDFLKQSFSIDFSKVNTGFISFTNYKYYVNQNDIRISFLTENYADETKGGFKNLTISATNLSNLLSKTDTTSNKKVVKPENYADNGCEYDLFEQIEDSKKLKLHSESGLLLNTYNIAIPRQNLSENEIYLVQFKVQYGNTPKYFYRLLFNSDIFNQFYISCNEFRDLTLSQGLNLTIDYPKLNNIVISKKDIQENISNNIEKYSFERNQLLEKSTHEIKLSYVGNLNINQDSINDLSDFKLTNIVSFSSNVTNNTTSEVSITTLQNPIFNIINNVLTDNSEFDPQNAGKFQLTIPYKINYYDLYPLKRYAPSPLVSSSTQYYLGHKSTQERNGEFILKSKSSTQNDFVDIVSVPVADEATDITISINDSIEPYIFFNDNIDYININFGIYNVENGNDKGYKYSGATKVIYTKNDDEINKHSALFSYFRTNDNGKLLVHKKINQDDDIFSIKNSLSINTINGKYLYDLRHMRKWEHAGETSNIYKISKVTPNENIVLTQTVTITFDADCNFTYKGIEIPVTATNNLRFKNKNFKLILERTITVDIMDFINDLLSLNDDIQGIYIDDRTSPEPYRILLTEKHLKQVGRNLETGEGISEILTINQDKLVIDSSKLEPVDWYFCWEADAGGNLEELQGWKQYYKVQHTYAINESV